MTEHQAPAERLSEDINVIVGWMHPAARWVAKDRDAVAAHCWKDGPQPIALYAADTVEALRSQLAEAREALKLLLDPDALRTAMMMSGAHLSHAQAMTIIEDDRFGAAAALSKSTPTPENK